MMLYLALPLLTLALSAALAGATPEEAGAFDHSHQALTEVLRKHVDGDRVDYAALKEGRAALDAYTASLESVDPGAFGAWTSAERYAFWINVYNAYTLEIVTDHYPLASIRDIERDGKEVWDIPFLDLARLAPGLGKERLSLNDVEHQILRKQFEDARVHAAVNCASRGCPPLAGSAFTAEGLDAMLDAQVRAWLADPSRNRLEAGKNCLELSKIFEWFKDDFVRDGGSVEAWVANYAPAETAAFLKSRDSVKIRFLDYSWKLNDIE